MPRASEAQQAERLNRARVLLREVDQFSDAVERLAQDCSISTRQAYRYLPDSVERFVTPDELVARMRGAGLRSASYQRLGLGTIAVHTAIA